MRSTGKLESKIGQLIVGKVQGTQITDEEKKAIASGIMGGVTLFKENAADLHQLSALIDSIRAACPAPPLIAVDQEGGAVQRFDHVLSPLPSAMAQAAASDADQAKSMAGINARQLSLLGINCLLSPVLDVCSHPLNPIGTRAFSSDPQLVKSLSSQVAETFEQHGLLAVGKHFPGHGATLEDSHTHLAVNHCDAKTLWQRELLPFRALAKRLPVILTAHVWLPEIDPDPLPSSLSPRVSTGLLREYLGFNGVVMTDDMLMKAVTEKWGLEEASVLAILAGADQLLVCGQLSEIRLVHKALLKAVKSGRISEARLTNSLSRINDALSKLPSEGISDKPEHRLSELEQLIKQSHKRCLEVSISSICLLRGWLPKIAEGEWVVIAPDHPRYKLNLHEYLKQAFSDGKANPTFIDKRYSLNPSADEISHLSQFCSQKNCIYVTFRALLNKGQIQLGRQLSECARERLNVAADVPYDLIGLPNWDNCLASFDPSDLAMEALSVVLSGQRKPQGVCPVSLQIEI